MHLSPIKTCFAYAAAVVSGKNLFWRRAAIDARPTNVLHIADGSGSLKRRKPGLNQRKRKRNQHKRRNTSIQGILLSKDLAGNKKYFSYCQQKP